jgi:uncharacterized protein (DUF2252 family)
MQDGKAYRKQVPRRQLGAYEPSASRPDPVALLGEQAANRVAELVPIRYGRMLTSPFAFFRGAALIMARDLASAAHTDFAVQLCGDAHLLNFGVFASPERRLVFDINDFDETYPGPFDWDVRRLAASLAIAGRHIGFDRDERQSIVKEMALAYRQALRQFASMSSLEIWYAHASADLILANLKGGDKRHRSGTQAAFDKARSRDHLQAVGKLTQVVGGQRRIVSSPPTVVPIEELAPEADPEQIDQVVRQTLDGYAKSLSRERAFLLSRYTYVHAARKVVGVGSVGTRVYVVLMEDRRHGSPLLLQVKEAQPSVLQADVAADGHSNDGERVVNGQHLMQAVSDIFLGWHRVDKAGEPRDFYVRQLRDWKGSAEVETMDRAGLGLYGRLCAWTLARAHARSGDVRGIASYLGSSDVFDQAMADFAEAYADQNQADYDRLQEAADRGEVQMVAGT